MKTIELANGAVAPGGVPNQLKPGVPEKSRPDLEFVSAQYEAVQKAGLIRLFEPRRLQPPPGYHSTRAVAGGLFANLEDTLRHGVFAESTHPAEVAAHLITLQVIRYNVPLYFIAEEFARVVVATELPHDFTVGDLHWPMPGMVLGFPVRFMQEYMGREVCFVNAANLNVGTYSMPELTGNLKMEVVRPNAAWQCHSWEQGQLMTYVASCFQQDQVDQAIHNCTYLDYSPVKDVPTLPSGKAIVDLLSALVLKLLLILNTCPQLVEEGRCVRTAKIKRGRMKHCELWSPNIIGRGYRVSREVRGEGSHATPRLHWRRGHLRNQPYGPGRSMRKTVWIEPVLVGIEADEDAGA